MAAHAVVDVGAGDPPLSFARDIRPLLSDRCFQCHGPDAENAESDLRLDSFEAATLDLGGYAAVVPGDVGESELMARIRHSRSGLRMPPPASKIELTDDEVRTLERWVEEGASFEPHWAFEAPVPHGPPRNARVEEWARGDLDRFVGAALVEAGIALPPGADPGTLLRRLTLDLTGLPPSPEDAAAFLADPSESAYEGAVDRLLASTAHAEKLTAMWLDVARYADTFGYQADRDMKVWPWRDWVIRAFEENLPYDEFLTWQLAGDLLPDATRESRLATTFNRLHRQTNEGGSVEEEFRVESVCDRVETMAGAFLGLTVGCAKCHDHKFDPITQGDYFRLFAYFDGIDESGLYSHFTDAVPTPALALPTEDQERALDAAVELSIEREELLPPPEEGPIDVQVFESFDDASAGEGGVMLLDGEEAVEFKGAGVFHRWDPFTIALRMQVPGDAAVLERAVVIHRTKSWTDSGSRGYQLLVEDGRLTVALVHFWPGDAIATRSKEEVPTGEMVHVAFTYDGSSRAEGLRLFLDGEQVPTEVIRDHLTRTIRGGAIGDLAIGSRFRDKGFKGGLVDDVAVVGGVLRADEVRALARPGATPGTSLEPRPMDPAPFEALRSARKARDGIKDSIRQIMTMAEGPALPAAQRTAYRLERGDYGQRREALAPGTPGALPKLLKGPVESRLDLARWLTHPDHPLTARVHVDRLWRFVFRTNLVPTPEDFGSQCPPPVHDGLLDALSVRLVESGWDTRAMLRTFVMSSTYRMSSVPSAAALAEDPDNRLQSRASGAALTAEEVRDGILASAGLLNRTRGGPPVYPYQPPGLWQEKRGVRYPVGRGADLVRRSLYTFWRRTSPPPTPSMFNAPSREVCTVARPSTSTPLQTLVLWNDPQFVAAAVALAKGVDRDAGMGTETEGAALIEVLFQRLASRAPNAEEMDAFSALLRAQRAEFESAPARARALAAYDLEKVAHPGEEAVQSTGGDAAPGGARNDGRVAALAVVASALFGLPDVTHRR